MYGLWMYVFCLVVVGTSLDYGSSLQKPQKTDILSLDENFFNTIIAAFDTSALDSEFKKVVDIFDWLPQASALEVAEKASNLSPLSSGGETCFEGLGCFSNGPPWNSILRPIGEPMNPTDIDTSVDFFSPQNPTDPVTVSLYPEIDLEEISFSPNITTVVIVHGFLSSGYIDWVRKIKTAYLKVKDANVFALNWSGGAQGTNYLTAVANTRVVGKELALLIKKLIDDYEATAENFHLIGHSLGSHICSYAAKEIPGIGRLTALDPAQPAFEGYTSNVRLDKNDADFVEVFHTDARPFLPSLGAGMIAPHGHVDFYFNGGFNQPGCLTKTVKLLVKGLKSLQDYPIDEMAEYFACPHTRAYEYFIETLDTSTCTFWGRKLRPRDMLNDMKTPKTNKLRDCENSPDECIPLGLDAIDSPLRGSFDVRTSSSSPYCEI